MIPLCIPDYVQRNIAGGFVNVPVYARRVIMQVSKSLSDNGVGMIYKVLGTINTILYNIPVQMYVDSSSLGGRVGVFRSMCSNIARVVCGFRRIGDNNTDGDANDGDDNKRLYFHSQWSVCILHDGSTIGKGPCTLLYESTTQSLIKTREVSDSLMNEMSRMGCLTHGSVDVTPLQPFSVSSNNRDIVTVTGIVDHLAVWFGWNQLKHQAVMQDVTRIQCQPLDIHRFLSMDSQGLRDMLRGFHSLWCKSFHSHRSYLVDMERVQCSV